MTSTIKVNNIQNQCGANIINENSNTITLGASGDTIALASGASQTGFGRTGTVNWCTTAKTSPLTAESGKGYFINTTGGAITVTLPASPSAGDIVALKDYANTWDDNNVTLCRNSSKINAVCGNVTLSTEDQSITLIYVDSTRGWRAVHDSTSDISGAAYITATGGTITTSGDYKIHKFTSSGTFCVTGGGGTLAKVDYMVVAGGGGGGGDHGGGGGAGGFRESHVAATSGPYTASPLASSTSLNITQQAYPVTIGAGGAGGEGQPSPSNPSGQGTWGTPGSNSSFSTITSAGGGGGAKEPYPTGQPTTHVDGGVGRSGGSGGGGSYTSSSTPQAGTGGAGNTPPVSPSQGFPGGTSPAVGSGSPYNASQGGGGATAVGASKPSGPQPQTPMGNGGAGATTHIPGSPISLAGGGGAGNAYCTGGTGGTGGGGAGNGNNAGSTNTGGGGGGSYGPTMGPQNNGG